jgi:hypothetical protein
MINAISNFWQGLEGKTTLRKPQFNTFGLRDNVLIFLKFTGSDRKFQKKHYRQRSLQVRSYAADRVTVTSKVTVTSGRMLEVRKSYK